MWTFRSSTDGNVCKTFQKGSLQCELEGPLKFLLFGTVISLQGSYLEEIIGHGHRDVCAEFCCCKVNHRKKRKKTKTTQVSSNGGLVKYSNTNGELLGSY